MIATTNPVTAIMHDMLAFGTTIPNFTPAAKPVYIDSVQILGFIPLVCDTPHSRLAPFNQCDCRDWTDDDCYINPVFGDSSGATDPLKNDTSGFMLEYPLLYDFLWDDPSITSFSLEKFVDGFWVGIALLNNNNLGTYNALGTMCIKNWTQFVIDWQKVIIAHGEGIYKFRVDNNLFGFGSTYESEPFCLKEWSCKAAAKTVRWDAVIRGGRVGSITNDQMVFDLCCERIDDHKKLLTQTWRDSVRVYGFFGKEKTEYERENIEYQNGEVIKIRDEAIQKFEYESALLPKYLHDRFKAYGIMADELLVSDYNWNNSDYEVKQKRVVCEGSYEPEYNYGRLSHVKVIFAEGFKNVIRDKCCPPTLFPSGDKRSYAVRNLR